MIDLLDYITNNQLKSLLYVHTRGKVPTQLFSLINERDRDIWILVLTSNTSIDRYENKLSYEVIYNDLNKYRSPLKFDVLMLDSKSVLDENVTILKGLSSKCIVPVPYKKELDETQFKSIKNIYFPHKLLAWFPLSFQQWLTRYKIFVDKKSKYSIVEFK